MPTLPHHTKMMQLLPNTDVVNAYGVKILIFKPTTHPFKNKRKSIHSTVTQHVLK
jgi:hypothetical protein